MHQSSDNYRRLVEGVADYAIYMLDPDGRVISWNSGAHRIKQYTADEIIGRHYRAFYPEEARLRGEPENNLIIAARDGRFEANAWRIRKDGSRFWANVAIEPLRDENGRLIGFAKVTSDITERRETEQKIREAGEQINVLIETVVDGVIQIDGIGRIQTCNPACLNLFGYRIEEVIGQDIAKLFVHATADQRHDFDAPGARKMKGSRREVEGRRKDGSHFPILLSVGEATRDGNPIFVIIVHDISEHKRTQEALVQAQKMEMVGQLSGGIAHDFNNLLTVIVGNAEALSDQLGRRHPLKGIADDIIAAGERGAELTQRLLAFSRRQLLRPAMINCNDLLASMQKLLRRALRDDIDIKADFEPDLNAAFADPAQLEAAILNLALNAQDAMAAGGRLTLATGNASLDDPVEDLHPGIALGDYIMIAVTDDGQGMPDDVVRHAFEPFYTTKEVGKGSGLGLSMVYGFVKQSNGHVTIHSAPRLGTTVRMYLPQAAAKPARSFEPSGDHEGVIPSGSETVLVVEDDPFVRSFVMKRLQSLGYAVVAAVDGNDALRKLRTDIHVDVVFTDIVMPGGINGWELIELVRQIRPRLPVLLTSGYALEILVQQGRLQPGAMVLTKPYRKEALARSLREVLLVGSLSPLPEKARASVEREPDNKQEPFG